MCIKPAQNSSSSVITERDAMSSCVMRGKGLFGSPRVFCACPAQFIIPAVPLPWCQLPDGAVWHTHLSQKKHSFPGLRQNTHRLYTLIYCSDSTRNLSYTGYLMRSNVVFFFNVKCIWFCKVVVLSVKPNVSPLGLSQSCEHGSISYGIINCFLNSNYTNLYFFQLSPANV